MMSNKIKVLIVDDSVVFRSAVADSLKGAPDIQVIGSVRNGVKAIEFIHSQTPDIVTLDVEMPEMDGLATLRAIQDLNASKPDHKDIGVVMLSAHTQKGAGTTIEALESGALDFIAKPMGENIGENISELKSKLLVKIRVFGAPSAKIKRNGSRHGLKKIDRETPNFVSASTSSARAIVIGVSTGGPKALGSILPELTKGMDLPIFIVQHMPPTFTKSLAESLDKKCDYKVCEAVNSDVVKEKHVYLAPGGKHLELWRDRTNNVCTKITSQEAENGCRPSANILFRSVASVYGGDVIALILTGMGSDGTSGLATLKKLGAYVIAQDEQSSVVWGMPGSAVNNGVVDEVQPITEIPMAAIMAAKNFRGKI